MEIENSTNNQNRVYGFSENEKEILAWWEKEQIFRKLQAKNRGGSKYRFLDGPITANNPMGIHHVWGRTLKDTFLRYKAMKGFESHYRNGFDGQGLWVEVEVEKELGFTSKMDIETYGIDHFTEKCMERVTRCAGIITEQSKRLGQWMDWENSYYTNHDRNITSIWAFLKKCSDKGWIKKIHRPMPWCPRCGTSLSEHEMTGSYRELEHEAVYARLPLVSQEADILVWTTTPWTLAANTALAVNKNLAYVLVQLKSGRPLWMGKSYFLKKYSAGSEKEVEVLCEVKGEYFNDLEYETFFPELEAQKSILHKIVLWDEVQEEEGCQVVHIAPGCGAEDFALGEAVKLPLILPVDEAGVFYEGFGFLSGKAAKNVREEVFEELKARNKLHYTHKHRHSYPVCWRCKEEVLFRLSGEWAIDVSQLRPQLIENAKKVRWNPPYQEKRMLDWLENMGDWCISRSRYYGLPLPIYECSHCGRITVIGSLEELEDKAADKEVFRQIPHLHRPFIDKVQIYCPDCHSQVSRIRQVGDVWLDAGIVPFSTLTKDYFPAEYVIEMKEQIRLWFYSMLFMSTVLVGEPPYEQVGTHGMVTAEDGRRFSKTGFMIQFEEAADRIGADASRYIFAQNPLGSDVRFGFGLGEESRRKLLNYYNIAVFFMTYGEIDKPFIDLNRMNTCQFDPSDRWLLCTITQMIQDTERQYEEYSTKDVIRLFEAAVDDISNFYIRINRKRFWQEGYTEDKKAAYTVLFYSLKVLTQIAAPICPFITEYVWQNVIKQYSSEAESVHLSTWPMSNDQWLQDTGSLLTMVENTRDIIRLSLKIRNEKKLKVKQKLACAILYFPKDQPKPDAYFEQLLKNEMNVSRIEYTNSAADLQEPVVKLNFKAAGHALKSEAGRVNEILKALNTNHSEEISRRVLAGQPIQLPGYEKQLEAEIFTVEYREKENLGTAFLSQLGVALDTRLTEDLKNEGLLRMILRQCQMARKKAGYKINDKVYLNIRCEAGLENLIRKEKTILENELLAAVTPDFTPDYEEKVSIGDYEITIQLGVQA